MQKPGLAALFLAFALILAYLLRRRSASITHDPQPADCSAGSVSTHPASGTAREILEAALANDRGTGISAAVVIDGELVFADAIGDASQTFNLGPSARLRTGSVAKLFTAVAAARLAEMNRLDVHAPIGPLMPEFPHGEITPYQLGTHTSGIRHYDFGKLSEANNLTHYPTLTDALELFSAARLLSQPGAEFHYSSFGFNLLGVVVERASAGLYESALRDLIARPLALSSLSLDNTMAAVPCRPAFSTILFGRVRINSPRRDNSDLYPSGGLVVSAPDLARFADAVFNSDFLQAETLALLTSPAATPDGKLTGYAFGWQLGRSADGAIEWYGHGGQVNGAYASVRYYPAHRMTVAGLSNYNTWLTSSPPKFFEALRVKLPPLFAGP